MRRVEAEARRGVLAIVAACMIWGFAPLLYHHIAEVPALELMAHRTVWTGVMFGALILGQGRGREILRMFAGPSRGRVLAAGLLIGVNWALFIWAVNADHGVEASLGYYILPLVSAALGFLVLGERLGPWQVAGLALACLAVALLTWGLGVAPWIALALAGSFSLYSLVKKPLAASAPVVVLGEVLVIGGPMLAVLAWAGWTGGPAGAWGWFGRDWAHSLWLLALGPVSGLPLMLFSWGAQRVKLATSGLVAYLNPTLQLGSAVFILGQPVTAWHGLALALIWAAIGLYSFGAWAAQAPAAAAKGRAASAASSAATSGRLR